MSRLPVLIVVVLAALTGLHGHGMQAQTSRIDPQAIELIHGTAVLICGDFARTGTEGATEIDGSAEARLHGLAGQLADIGVEGTGSIASSEYVGVLREQLGPELQDVRACRLEIWKDLRATLFAAPGPTPDATNRFEAATGQSELMRRVPGRVDAVRAGWMVIMGTFSVPANADAHAAGLRASGMPVEVVDTDNYKNLTDGYRAVVIGTSDRNSADAALPLARAFVPDAYVKSPW